LAFKIISENLYTEYSYFLSTEKSCFTGSIFKFFKTFSLGDLLVGTFLKINEKSDYFPTIMFRDDCIPILQLYLELGAFVNIADSKRGVLDSKTEYYKFTEEIKDLEEFSKQIYSRYKEIQRIQSIVSSYPIIQMFYKSIMDKKSGIEIKDRYYRFYTYPKCFIGKSNRVLNFFFRLRIGWLDFNEV
jgi:hypothetical protein